MKKYMVCILVAFSVLIPVKAQTDELQLYQRKIQSYNKMQKAGWTMTGIGGGLAITGSVLLITLDDAYWDDDELYIQSDDEEDAIEDVFQAVGGIICLGIGIGLVAGGVTLGSIGSHKARTYKQKLDNLSIGMIVTPNRQGFTLTYRF